MLKVDNINFKGNFRYMGATIQSLDYISAFELAKNNVSKELLDFSNKSSFLNKLKENKDVFLHHHKEMNIQKEPKKKSFFEKLFLCKKENSENRARIGNEHITIVFKNTDNAKETELCEISITLPINKGTPSNLDRFGRILDNYINIKELKEKANQLFPDNSHKLTLLPNNENHGWCEFWTGEKTAFDTLDRLHIAMLQQVRDITLQNFHKLMK